jgi:DNA-binding SARP family transcriptional activator
MSGNPDLYKAIGDLHRALTELVKAANKGEIAVLTSLVIYDQKNDQANEYRFCNGLKDIIELQLDSLKESIRLSLDYECKCGRLVMDSWKE